MKSHIKNQQEQAAQLLAEGRYQYAEIAEKIGIEVRTLYKWRALSTFTERVSQLSSDFQKRSWSLGITRKYYRINCLASVHSKLLTVIEQRAEDPDMQNVPGGKTGLLVKTFKVSGEMVMAEYAVDTGLIRVNVGISSDANGVASTNPPVIGALNFVTPPPGPVVVISGKAAVRGSAHIN
ncbi:phBC6A51 family helix-turn-helix protein [Granulicella sp. L60]|uniref:phBC6A51 family helix-turn-helix protein n=1 Tax=Granulicella sp. L60 TaxID=1641866 RepID=UPI00131D9029|nr:phBC6A51 family helix-turn-helix protein [Granulicella sp. L60]